jgi:hypothetical protein
VDDLFLGDEMPNTVHMKFLIAILTALTVLSAVLIQIEMRNTLDTTIATKRLRDQEQIRKDDEEYRKQLQAQTTNKSETLKKPTP